MLVRYWHLFSDTNIGWGRHLLPHKIRGKTDPPLWKTPTSHLDYVATVKASEKVHLSRLESRPRAFQRAIDVNVNVNSKFI